jgi:hypothetical protein
MPVSVDLGDVHPLSITITDPSGVLANAGAVSVTITLPDGTAETHGPITPTSTGIYDYDYPTVQAGWHHARWVATGANASAYTDNFVVDPPVGGDFIGLADAIHHLRKKSLTVDAEALRQFVGAACQMITDRMGQVAPLVVVADLRPRCGTLVLPTRPVISITSVQRLPGLVAVPQADAATGAQGWTLESSEGVMSVSGWSGLVRVTWRAGRSPLPKNFRLAGLELIAHLWRGSQHNQAGGRPALGGTDALSASVNAFAMPYRVMELLGLKKHQERDEPLVG